MNYINTTTLTQHSESDLRALFPNTSFPVPFVAPSGYALVFPAPQPAHNAVTQSVIQVAPELTVLGHWEQRWSVTERYATQVEKDAAIAADITTRKAQALIQIDTDTDALYGAVLGNRAEEYTLAANEAQAFKTAGYTGTVPSSVQSWATAKNWTATQAADDILSSAAQWVGAQSAIRAGRLLRKEQVRAATGAVGITATMTAWAGFVAYMRGQLGLVS